jgi:hypothetical protein
MLSLTHSQCPMVERHLVATLTRNLPTETMTNHAKRSMVHSYPDSTDHVEAMDVGFRKTNLSLLRRGTLYLILKTYPHYMMSVSRPFLKINWFLCSFVKTKHQYKSVDTNTKCQFMKRRRHQRHVMKGPQYCVVIRLRKKTSLKSECLQYTEEALNLAYTTPV